MKRINIMNAKILSVTMTELLENLNSGVLLTPNVDHLVRLQKDRSFYEAYQQAEWIVCDSQILRLAGLFLNNPFRGLISGSTFFPAFYRFHKNHDDVSIFLLGGKTGVAEKAMENINVKVERKMVTGALSPSFGFESDEAENTEIVNAINKSQATVLVVGVGAPKQELWIMKNRHRLDHVRLYMALGATVDFEAGTKKRAPALFRKLCLEWLYRLLQEPARLYRRYLIDDLSFFKFIYQQKLGLYKNPFDVREPEKEFYQDPNIYVTKVA